MPEGEERQAGLGSASGRRALVTGHFSTVGDLEVLHVVEERLRRLGLPFAVSPFSQRRVAMDPGWVMAESLDPLTFSHLIVVCGPYAPDYPAEYPEIFGRFRHCTHVGVNLTMVAPLSACDPFDALLERDSDRTTRPDLSFLHEVAQVPVVGLCLARPQREYGRRQRHDRAAERLRVLLRRAGAAVIELDTTVPRTANRAGIGTEAEFEAILGRLDAVVTTRLHGMVLALKNGVPVLAVDAIAGGDKVSRQAELLGWPEIHAIETVTDADLDASLRRCLSSPARATAAACADRARQLLEGLDASFAAALDAEARPDRRPPVAPRRGRLSRLAAGWRDWKRRRFPRKG